MSLVHETADVSGEALLGAGVTVGAFTVIHAGVEIGEGTTVGSHCLIGAQPDGSEHDTLRIGPRSKVRSHSVIYLGSELGEDLQTGHHVTIREGTIAGEGLHVGTLSDVQGQCRLGNRVRIHSNVHIGQYSIIGNFVWIFPYVVLTNDPHPPSEVRFGVKVDDFAAIATMSVILPGVCVGEGSLVGAGSVVTADVEPRHLVSGVPARDRGPVDRIILQDGTGRPAYPWTTHFRRGYPAEITNAW